MLKFTTSRINNQRKAIAYVGVEGEGLFLRAADGKAVYLNRNGDVSPSIGDFEIVANNRALTPIYEGDTLTIQF